METTANPTQETLEALNGCIVWIETYLDNLKTLHKEISKSYSQTYIGEVTTATLDYLTEVTEGLTSEATCAVKLSKTLPTKAMRLHQ
jgi:hypothetical protein